MTHSSRTTVVGLVLLVGLATPTSATSDPLPGGERRVLGWTTTGGEIIVRLQASGDLMLEGGSQNYYFEATETFSSRGGKLLNRYRHDAPSGPTHPVWTAAKPQTELDQYLGNAGLVPPHSGWRSPDAKFALASSRHQEVVSKSGVFRCEVNERIVLFDSVGAKVLVVSERRESGEPTGARRDARCPRATLEAFWSPDSKHWAVTRHQRSGEREGWLLVAGDTERPADHPEAAILPAPGPHERWLERRPAATAAAWRALASGDSSAALAAFESAGELCGQALVLGRQGHAKRSKRLLEKTTPSTPSELGCVAAAWLAQGNRSKTETLLAKAIETTPSAGALVELASLFSMVDVGLSNQLLVHALSRADLPSEERGHAYAALVRGLIDAGSYSKAAELLQKWNSESAIATALSIRLDLDRGGDASLLGRATGLLLSNPGDCEAWLLAGRAYTTASRPADAAVAFVAASQCEPRLAEAWYYVGDLDRLRADLAASARAFEAYLAHAPARSSDPVREARRAHLATLLPRLRHAGVVISQASCRKAGAGLQCRVTLFNGGSDPVTDVPVQLFEEGKRGRTRTVGAATVTIAPGETTHVVVASGTAPGAKTTVSAGRDDLERTLNTVQVSF